MVEKSLELKLNSNRRVAYLKKNNIEPGQDIQLSLAFPILNSEKYCFLPNDFARCALFTARNRTQARETFQRVRLFHLHDGVTVYYSGIELRAYDDELIWQQIMRYQRLVPFGTPIRFTLSKIIDDLGWTRSGQRYDTIRLSISRLKATEILIHNEKAFGRSPSISLIDTYTTLNDVRAKPSEYEITINPNMALLFAGNTFSKHTWEKYRGLAPMARRLADYIASHKFPLPLKVEDFSLMCGLIGTCPAEQSKIAEQSKTARKAAAEIVKAGLAVACHVKKGVIYPIRGEGRGHIESDD